MNIVDPDSVFRSQRPPPLVLTKVLVNDTASLPLQSISAGPGLQLSYDENVLEFGFAGIDPGATHLIDYFYRLEGLEKGVGPIERAAIRKVFGFESGQLCLQSQGNQQIWSMAGTGDRPCSIDYTAVVAHDLGIWSVRISLCGTPLCRLPV